MATPEIDPRTPRWEPTWKPVPVNPYVKHMPEKMKTQHQTMMNEHYNIKNTSYANNVAFNQQQNRTSSAAITNAAKDLNRTVVKSTLWSSNKAPLFVVGGLIVGYGVYRVWPTLSRPKHETMKLADSVICDLNQQMIEIQQQNKALRDRLNANYRKYEDRKANDTKY